MTKQTARMFTVTITDRYPAAGEQPSKIEVRAYSKRDAVAKVSKAGWRSRYDSPVTYTAEED